MRTENTSIASSQGQPDKPQKSNRNARFVYNLFNRCGENKGFAARMKRASSPCTEPDSWEFFISYGIDIVSNKRLPYILIASAIAHIAHDKQKENGTLLFAKALAKAFSDGNQNEQARKHLRRIFTCKTSGEACHILRPLISLIQNRLAHKEALDYQTLLDDLTRFDNNPHYVKAQWAKQFYRTDDVEQQERDSSTDATPLTPAEDK